jgi:uncharacterized membrane protein YeaQ/YmgE (transglycosylase-associated protein family)
VERALVLFEAENEASRWLADLLGFGKGAAGGGDVVNIYSIVVAVIGAVIAVIVVNMLTRRRV